MSPARPPVTSPAWWSPSAWQAYPRTRCRDSAKAWTSRSPPSASDHWRLPTGTCGWTPRSRRSAPGGRVGLYAVGSLTVVRMLPVALALLGTGMRRVTVGFLGWFGPRGLASIVFVLILVEETELPERSLML